MAISELDPIYVAVEYLFKKMEEKQMKEKKEIRNDIIDNVYLYRYTHEKNTELGEKTSVREIKGEILTGIGIKHNQARFKGHSSKTDLFVDPKPGVVRSGSIVWFNEPNVRGAVLAFMEYKLQKMEEANETYKKARHEYDVLKELLELDDEHDDMHS